MNITDKPSPNHSSRLGIVPSLIVIHHTSSRTSESAINWFQNPDSKVSSHYIIGRDGQVYRIVEEKLSAWHTGACRWPSDMPPTRALNRESIGIELQNIGDGIEPFPEAQMRSLADLIQDIRTRYPVPPEGIVGHRHIAWPRGRKDDPSRAFDWADLRSRLGELLTPPPPAPRTLRMGMEGDDVEKLQSQLIQLSYGDLGVPTGIFAERTEAAVRSFQQAQGIEVDGVVGKLTRAALERVLGERKGGW